MLSGRLAQISEIQPVPCGSGSAILTILRILREVVAILCILRQGHDISLYSSSGLRAIPCNSLSKSPRHSTRSTATAFKFTKHYKSSVFNVLFFDI